MSVGVKMLRNIFYEQNSREIKSKDNVFGEFLANKGLYDEIEITEENIYELADLVGGHVKLDIYCTECGENRIFSCEKIMYYWYDEHNQEIYTKSIEDEIVSWQQIQTLNNTPSPSNGHAEEPWTWSNQSIKDDTRIMVFKFVCAMDDKHHLDYIVLTHENKMKKVGQYPSVADLTFPELKEYRKVMSKEDERELKRAIGLYASGIGIGSFVYLRRIFERIIMSASDTAIQKGQVKAEDFNRAHVDEKIKMLVDYLPRSLVNNTVFYGIVSKGIHELSEEECLEYFPILKGFIMMTLRQWEKIRKDEEEEKNLANSLNSIASKVK